MTNPTMDIHSLCIDDLSPHIRAFGTHPWHRANVYVVCLCGDSDYGVEILATQARLSWLRFFLIESSVSTGGGARKPGETTAPLQATISKWPSLVVVNCAGESRRILGKLQSNEEAVAQADRVQTELDILGIAQW